MMLVSKKRSVSNFNVYISAFVANMTATAATCVISWSNPTVPKITTEGSRIHVTVEEASWLSSVAALGACCGPFINGEIVDHLGRKWTLMSVMVLLIVSWTIMYFSDVLLLLYWSRFVAGIGVGCVYGTLPMYIGEIAPVELRSMLCSLLQLFDCFGYLIEYIIGGKVDYESLILASAILPALCIVTLIWIPESPYYLYNKGRKKEALQALRFFRGYADVSTLQREIQDMEASAQNMETNKGSFKALLTKRGNLKCMYYSMGLILFQQMSGINIITFYSQSIFQESGSTFSPNMSAIIVAIFFTCTAVISVIAAKVYPVKFMLTWSAVGEIFGLFPLAAYFYLKEREDMTSFEWVPVTSLVIYILSYTMGFGPLVWVITSEIFPSHLKAIGCGLGASLAWFLSFLLTYYFMQVASVFGEAPIFFTFGMFCVGSLVFVRFQLPNTHHKTFQEIQDMIQGSRISSKKVKLKEDLQIDADLKIVP